MSKLEDQDTNLLYPVFFRMDKLKVLIVGAGEVGEEKLTFILKSSPNANITVVATFIAEETTKIIEKYPEANLKLILREVKESDIDGHDIVVAATNIVEVNNQVYHWAKNQGKIVNIADTPDLCDFYMGSIVTRGNVKIAISTNGKSPTFSKRLRQFLEEILDNDTASLVNNLNKIKSTFSEDFKTRVSELNDLTASLLKKTK